MSIPFFTEKWRPYSFYDKIKKNRDNGLHTLCLLDIKVKEPTLESLAKGKPVYMPPHYMKTDCAADQLLESVQKCEGDSYNDDTPCIGLARIGTNTQKIVSGTMKSFLNQDLGEPLHSFIICGQMHEMEQEMYNFFLPKE